MSDGIKTIRYVDDDDELLFATSLELVDCELSVVVDCEVVCPTVDDVDGLEVDSPAVDEVDDDEDETDDDGEELVDLASSLELVETLVVVTVLWLVVRASVEDDELSDDGDDDVSSACVDVDDGEDEDDEDEDDGEDVDAATTVELLDLPTTVDELLTDVVVTVL